jgi:low affinity Fe/Cu permease
MAIKHAIRQVLTRFGELAAHPLAFGIWLLYAVVWLILDRDSLDWHGVATMVTWFMTLIIQRAEDRDTQALQAKLDELLRVIKSADDALTEIDALEPEDIKRLRKETHSSSGEKT